MHSHCTITGNFMCSINNPVNFSASLKSSHPSVCMCLLVGIGVFLQVHLAWALHHLSRTGSIDHGGGGGGACLVAPGGTASGAISGSLSS